MMNSITTKHIPPTSEDPNPNKICFMCQAYVDSQINTCTINIYALVGSRFQRYEQTSTSRNLNGSDVIFTPLGKAKITGFYCDNCKDACSKASFERVQKSKKRHKLVVIISLVSLLLAVGTLAWSDWFILPGLAALLSLYVAIAALVTRKSDTASIENQFTMEAKLMESDSFKKQLVAISAKIDVSHIRYKIGVPGDLVHGAVMKATKEDNLLFVPDDTMLRKNVLNENLILASSQLGDCAAFGTFYPDDYFDGRYWYRIHTGDNSVTSDDISNFLKSLVGFDCNGNCSIFRPKYTYKYNSSYDGNSPPKVKFKDDKNSNIALSCD